MNPGETIRSRYQIEVVLGQGSMGTTYKAIDLKTRRPVAAKILHFSRMQEWKSLELFEREAKILQQLDHPRIPAYIEYFAKETGTDVRFVLIQEYIAGKTLEQLVKAGWRGTEEEVAAFFWQLVDVLEYLHTLQPPVIHRDINPKNIILSPDNKVYLVDFGAVQERIRATFLGGSTVGTFGYMPFEQIQGQTMPASDYYALGATLLYLLTHRHPTDFPVDEMKPKFHAFLKTSPKILRLLDGLLEPDVNKRLTSPDQIHSLLKQSSVVQAETPLTRTQKEIPAPSGTKIEKIVKEDNVLYFCFPEETQLSSSESLSLELSPSQVKLRKSLSSVWSIPTDSFRDSDLTWHIEKHRAVLGINHNGKTLVISSTLTVPEAKWLIQEIQAYISAVAISTLPEEVRTKLTQTPEPSFEQFSISPSGDIGIKFLKGKEHVRIIILNRKRADIVGGLLFVGVIMVSLPLVLLTAVLYISSVWLSVFMVVFTFVVSILIGVKVGPLFGKRFLDLTPTSLQLEKKKVVPISSLRDGDINWYVKESPPPWHLRGDPKVLRDDPKVWRRPVVGINYAGKTLEIDENFTQEDAEWLVQKLRGWVSKYRKLDPLTQVEPGEDQKELPA